MALRTLLSATALGLACAGLASAQALTSQEAKQDLQAASQSPDLAAPEREAKLLSAAKAAEAASGVTGKQNSASDSGSSHAVTPHRGATEEQHLQRPLHQVEQAAQSAKMNPPALQPNAVLPQQTFSSVGVDPMRFVERAMSRAQEAPSRDEPQQIMIFVSTNMPEPSLRRLAADAAKLHLPLYLRGLRYGLGQGNFQKGTEDLARFKSAGVQFQIHPQLFSSYGIERVPAVVIAPEPKVGCTDDSCAPASAIVLGDVPLEYALQTLSDRADDIGAISKSALEKFRNSTLK